MSADESFSDDGSRATSSYRDVPLPTQDIPESPVPTAGGGGGGGGGGEGPAGLTASTPDPSPSLSLSRDEQAGRRERDDNDNSSSSNNKSTNAGGGGAIPTTDERNSEIEGGADLGRRSSSPQTPLHENMEALKVRDADTGKQYVLEKVYRIKDLDTGKEFVVDAETSGDTGVRSLVQLDTGEELTMAEFEKNIGLQSPLMREMNKREDSIGKGAAPKLIDSSDDEGAAVREIRGKTKKKWFQKGLKTLKSKALHAGDALAETFMPKENKVESAAGQAQTSSLPQEEEFWHPGGKVGNQVKVNVHRKIYKEFTDLRITQEIGAHKGAVWSMKFSEDGMYLASAGQDEIIRIWEVKEDETSNPDTTKETSDKDKKRAFFKEKPYRIYGGHKADILDLCWSKTQFLLSSSMDKTVRLWHISMNECLRVFSHTDFVTSIQFHPIDDKYFLSGSLDEKVRLWSIPEQTVVDWVNIHEMVTAVCFSPDGKKAVIGSYKGKCRFYSVEGNQFEYITQMDVKNTRGKNSRGKKITGLQYMPGVDRFLLVTSNDSRIRMYDGFTLCCKYKGHRNANSQIASGFSPGGGFVACGSEDGGVCIWSTINTFIPSVNPFYTGYRSDKNASFESFLAHNDIVTSAVFAPLQNDPATTKKIAGSLGIAPPTKAAEALVKPSLKRLGLGKSRADQEREEAQRAGETAMRAAAAVGQRIVTSGFSGEIRIFENVGLPIWL